MSTTLAPSSVARRLRIHGRVQGVAYRHHMTQEALRLGLSGWVRNRLDGTVEAVVCGAEPMVMALIAWAQRGPPLARVDRMDTEPAECNLTGFEQRPTA